jgi:hypothetical protein
MIAPQPLSFFQNFTVPRATEPVCGSVGVVRQHLASRASRRLKSRGWDTRTSLWLRVWDSHMRPVVVVLACLALLVALVGLAVAVALRRRQLTAWNKAPSGSPRPKTTRAAWLVLFGGLGLAVAIELVVFSL